MQCSTNVGFIGEMDAWNRRDNLDKTLRKSSIKTLGRNPPRAWCMEWKPSFTNNPPSYDFDSRQ